MLLLARGHGQGLWKCHRQLCSTSSHFTGGYAHRPLVRAVSIANSFNANCGGRKWPKMPPMLLVTPPECPEAIY